MSSRRRTRTTAPTAPCRTNYDTEQYQDYARGRALTKEQMAAWIDAFSDLLPKGRPLHGLDVGSGTGRYAPALASAFGPVTGIEPSDRMREVAQSQSQHPDVRYLAGCAEDIPVATASADYAVLLLSWHHVRDKPGAARELARAVRPGGTPHHPLRLRRPDALDLVARALPERLREGRRTVPAAARSHPDLHHRRLARRAPSAPSPSPPPAPAPRCSNGSGCAPTRSSTSSPTRRWPPGSSAWRKPSRADPDAPAPADPAPLLSFERH